jgi:hypothetical protein
MGMDVEFRVQIWRLLRVESQWVDFYIARRGEPELQLEP